jgi:peptidoglycan/LPS O-acetylase OafA/YrhL
MIELDWVGYVATFVAMGCPFIVSTIFLRFSSPMVDKPRIGAIDGARGYLAMAVVVHHFLINWNYTYSSDWRLPSSLFFANLGPEAVIMFFMITAFLFYGKLLRNTGRIDWRAIFIGRLLRLGPLFYSALCLVVAISIIAKGGLVVPPIDFVGQLANWATFTIAGGATRINDCVQSNRILLGAAWSLAYEWCFYLSLPLLALTLARLPRWTRILVLSVATVLISSVPALNFFNFYSRQCAPFWFGMLALEVTSFSALRPILRSSPASLGAGLAIGVALLLADGPYTLTKMVLLFFAFCCIASDNNLFGLLSRLESRLLGDSSYSIYLLHGFILFAIGYVIHGRSDPFVWVLLPVATSATAAFSIITYRYIERPFMCCAPRSRRGGQTTADGAP